MRAMMRDAANLSQPHEFHGFRFVEPALLAGLESSGFQRPQPGAPSALRELAGVTALGYRTDGMVRHLAFVFSDSPNSISERGRLIEGTVLKDFTPLL